MKLLDMVEEHGDLMFNSIGKPNRETLEGNEYAQRARIIIFSITGTSANLIRDLRRL